MRSADLNVKIDVFTERSVRIDLINKHFLQKSKVGSQVPNGKFFISFKLEKGSSSSLSTLSNYFSEISALFRQLVQVLFETAFHAFPNMIIAHRIYMVCIGSFQG